MSKMNNSAPITKSIIHAGQLYIPILEGSKVHFHFQTWKLDKERVLLDDSKKIGKKEPMMLVIGHKFKLEVWEQIVQLMAVGEVASFKVKKELLTCYPLVSKTLRDLGNRNPIPKHSCTMTLQTEGLGYSDLDELMSKPCDLEFIIELLKVEKPGEYEKDMWQLSYQQMRDLIPELKEKGNKLYAQKLYDEAEEAYREAIAICEQFLLKERKGDVEWTEMNNIKLPILLNYAQCKLVKGEFYSVIEHCTYILEYDKENEKALYRRAKAHVGAWNPSLAENDFNMLKKINPSMTAAVDRELENIRKMRKEVESKDRANMKNLFSNSMQNHTIQ